MHLRWNSLVAMVVLSAGACATVLALAPAGCIPDLPANESVPAVDATTDAPGAPDAADAADGAPAPPPGPPRCGDGVVQLTLGEQCDPGAVAADSAPPLGCSGHCRVDCLGGFHWSRNDHCYVDVLPAANSINDAINRCPAGTHVVTFAGAEELAAVAGGLDAGAFWVGMYEGLNKFDSVTTLEPAWEPGCSGCFAQVPEGAQGLPGADASPACVEGLADLDASWQQVPCTTAKRLYHLVCEWEPSGRLSQTCEAGACFDLRATFGSKRYVYVKLAAGFDSAEQQCEALGGTLVVLQSRDEREQLWKELTHVGLPGQFWIGLSIPEGGTAWTWADDASVGAYDSPWAFHQPRDGGTHAYVLQTQNGGTPPPVDDTLARVETSTLFLPFVCQLPAQDQ